MSILKKLSMKLFTLSLFAAAFGFTTLYAQTVAYVSNFGSNTVSVINTASNTVIATIAVGKGPEGVVFSPDGTRAYVANIDGTVSVIDTASNTVVATVALRSGAHPFLLAITPDGKSLYATDSSTGSVIVINTATNTVSATIPIAGGVSDFDVAVTPDGSRAYVAIGTASVIDIANNIVVGFGINLSAAGPLNTILLAVTPDGGHIYAASGGGSAVTVIDTATNTPVSIPGVPGASALAITPDGASVYVTDGLSNNGKVSVIDTASNTVQPDLIMVGSATGLLAITPDGAFVYVTGSFDNTVSVIATASNTVVARVPVGNFPFGIAIANLSTPFAAFTLGDLDTTERKVSLDGDFTLGATSTGLDLAHQAVTLSVGSFTLTIPAGKFKQVGGQHHFVFHGTIIGLTVDFDLKAEHGSSTAFDYQVKVKRVDLDVTNPVTVTLKIGENTATTSVTHQ